MGKFPEECGCTSCEIYEPSCQRIEGKDDVQFVIDVKGYSKSQLHVKAEKGRLIVWGQRRAGETSLCKTIKLERHWNKNEIRPFLSGCDVNGAKLSITIKKPINGSVWAEVKNFFSTLNSKLKAHGDLAYRVVVITLLLIHVVAMIKFLYTPNV